jgi:protein adenylyltransferase
VLSSIDHHGRYAYSNQPRIAHWNLARLAEALLPLLAEDREGAIEAGNEALGKFPGLFEAAYAKGLRRKLGLVQELPDDRALAEDLLDRMAGNGADFTLTFRRLSAAAAGAEGDAAVRVLFADPTAYDGWAERWRRRLADDGGTTGEARAAAMRGVNPAFIPRNHLVEEALSAAVDNGDLGPFETLLAVLSRPYDDQPQHRRYAEPPRPEQVVRQTFCGT